MRYKYLYYTLKNSIKNLIFSHYKILNSNKLIFIHNMYLFMIIKIKLKLLFKSRRIWKTHFKIYTSLAN